MEYELAIGGTRETVPGGSALLLLHPSTGATDRIDTQFLGGDTDAYLVISTRTTAHEVQQKLEHYGVDEGKATIIDTLSIERGYSRRRANNVHYVESPDDFDRILDRTEAFFETTSGKRRMSLDSITEMAYFAEGDEADEENRSRETIVRLIELVRDHDAVGLFHLTPGAHDVGAVEAYRSLFDGVIEIRDNGTVDVDL